jgi:hypothetical protein
MEKSSGVRPTLVVKIWELLPKLREHGKSSVAVTQDPRVDFHGVVGSSGAAYLSERQG